MNHTLIDRALVMFGTRRTWVLGGRRYAISSANGDTAWVVDLNLTPPFCTCPQFAFRCQGTDICKHILFFLAFAHWYERLERVPPP